MTEQIYKICMMCQTVYEGDIKKYHEFIKDGGKLSHGVCDDKDCKSAYLTLALGCTKEDAED